MGSVLGREGGRDAREEVAKPAPPPFFGLTEISHRRRRRRRHLQHRYVFLGVNLLLLLSVCCSDIGVRRVVGERKSILHCFRWEHVDTCTEGIELVKCLTTVLHNSVCWVSSMSSCAASKVAFLRGHPLTARGERANIIPRRVTR